MDTFDEGAGEPLVQRQQELRAIWAALDRVHAQLLENKDPQGSMRPPALINTYGAGKSVLAGTSRGACRRAHGHGVFRWAHGPASPAAGVHASTRG